MPAVLEDCINNDDGRIHALSASMQIKPLELLAAIKKINDEFGVKEKVKKSGQL